MLNRSVAHMLIDLLPCCDRSIVVASRISAARAAPNKTHALVDRCTGLTYRFRSAAYRSIALH